MQSDPSTTVMMPAIDESSAAVLRLLETVGSAPEVDEDTEGLQCDSVWVLVRTLARRGCETEMHGKRLGLYAGRVAEAMGLDAAAVRVLRYAMPLHDVGMVAMPDTIVKKDGPYTSAEREYMKQHTTIGAEILSASDSRLMNMARSISLTHHERYDGKGYPRGLAHNAIPVEGRIAAVVDVFDALTIPRAYRQPHTMREAHDVIISGSGYQFDPVVTAAFLRVWDAVVSVRTEFSE